MLVVSCVNLSRNSFYVTIKARIFQLSWRRIPAFCTDTAQNRTCDSIPDHDWILSQAIALVLLNGSLPLNTCNAPILTSESGFQVRPSMSDIWIPVRATFGKVFQVP